MVILTGLVACTKEPKYKESRLLHICLNDGFLTQHVA